MANRLIIALLLGCTMLAAAGSAAAAAWQANGLSGELKFTAIQAGAKFTGRFREFTVALDLDPAAPANGQLDVNVKTRSADTADADRDAVLKGEDFLWTGQHAEAVYHAAGFRKDGNAWVANGELTLRGVKKPVSVRFTLQSGARGTVLAGSAKLNRLAFGIGQGDWADTTWIADPVDVAFSLKLSKAPAAAKP